MCNKVHLEDGKKLDWSVLRRAVDFKPESFRSNSPGRSDLTPAVTTVSDSMLRGATAVSGTYDAHSTGGGAPWNGRSASLGRVSSTPLSASPNAHPPEPKTWVPGSRDNHAERCVALLTMGDGRERTSR